MSREQPADNPEPGTGTSTNSSRVAFESLRERTDELELIISGISLLALMSLPSWLFQHWLQLELHAEGQRHELLSLGYKLLSGLSTTLACAFLLHLAVRAYWVGLIGLKATFPAGIRWPEVRNLGEIARGYQRRHLVDLDQAINNADGLASIVFALISLVTLSVLWIGGVLALVMLSGLGLAAWLGFSDDNTSRWGINFFVGVTFVVMFPSLILDSEWFTRVFGPAGPRRRRLVEGLTWLQGLLFPRRLILPVQLTLESNLPRWTFSLVFLGLIMGSIMLGSVQERAMREFALVSSYDHLNDADAEQGLRSAYYENLRSAHDALARVPLIPSDMVADGHLRVFLPYLPKRDNAALRHSCAAAGGKPARPGCLASLWQVSIDAKPADLADFVNAERRDLGMRGLQGYLSLAGLAPGKHELRLDWNAGDAATVSYRIPFWFSPPYQQDLAPAR